MFQELVFQELIFRQVTPDDYNAIRRYVREAAGAGGFGGAALEELIVAVNEAVANIVRHGFGQEAADITVKVTGGRDVVEVTLIDRGPAYDPTTAPAPDTTLALEQRPFGGLGVHMMREFCDELRYRRDPRGLNELTLMKRFNQ